MNWMESHGKGLVLCLAIALPSYFLGQAFPVIGGAVIAMILGMFVGAMMRDPRPYQKGIAFGSKKILQSAVVLLGFGLNLAVVLQTGKQSLPIILCTIATSLLVAHVLSKALGMPKNISTLVGVGSSICGGSAIATTAPVIGAKEEEIAQAISVIFFFNILAALLFPTLGSLLGFSTTSGETFGIFAGTAINDTSSVTAAAATWDSLYGLGSQTLDKAVTVKLTRTLAIIPITLFLAYGRAKSEKTSDQKTFQLRRAFPRFILYFILASLITTLALNVGIDPKVFTPFKSLSKFFIVMAMAAIGFNCDVVKLIKTGGKPLILGFSCWLGITLVSLVLQHFLGLW